MPTNIRLIQRQRHADPVTAVFRCLDCLVSFRPTATETSYCQRCTAARGLYAAVETWRATFRGLR